MSMSGLQGAQYHRNGPQPLGAVDRACLGPAWAGYNTWDALQITKSARMIVWKTDRDVPTSSQDADETASDAAWDPDQASVAASPDSADAASNASGGAEANHPEPSEHTLWAVGLRLARCAL